MLRTQKPLPPTEYERLFGPKRKYYRRIFSWLYVRVPRSWFE